MNAREPENRRSERLPDEGLLSVVAAIRELRADAELADIPAESTARSKEMLSELLGRCHAIQAEAALQLVAPIRTIHHFACTGGTLISKCLAAMPNVSLLSEVDPLSELLHNENHRFHPTDLIELMRVGNRNVTSDDLIEVFLSGIGEISRRSERRGLRLVLRDHAHSQFCFNAIVERPTLLEIVKRRFGVISIVTVRNPIDSYLSLIRNRWVHFSPATFDEYSRRYQLFLDAYADIPVFRYEDFVRAPQRVMKDICETLSLPLNSSFLEFFSLFRLSGDSGRRGKVIEERPRLELSPALKREVFDSINGTTLMSRLGYELES